MAKPIHESKCRKILAYYIKRVYNANGYVKIKFAENISKDVLSARLEHKNLNK